MEPDSTTTVARQYTADGFIVLRKFFSGDELAEVRCECCTLMQRYFTCTNESKTIPVALPNGAPAAPDQSSSGRCSCRGRRQIRRQLGRAARLRPAHGRGHGWWPADVRAADRRRHGPPSPTHPTRGAPPVLRSVRMSATWPENSPVYVPRPQSVRCSS